VTSLADEWDRYLASVPIEGYDRDRLAGMGRAFLQQVAPIHRDPALDSWCGVAVQNGVGMYRNGRSGST
jgi:hypothetical protein